MRKVLYVFVIISGILILVYLSLSKLCINRESARKINCLNNLKMIGLAMKMYAHEYDGVYPDDLYALYKKGYIKYPLIFLCPEVKHDNIPESFKDRSSFYTDYYYIPNQKYLDDNSEAETQIIAMDCQGNHEDYGNVLYGDGHVKGAHGDDLCFKLVPKKAEE